MPTRLHRSGGGLPGVFCMPAMHAGRLIEADCLSAVVPEPEWRMVRAVAVDVAERAAFTGYASDRFGAWELCAQRQLLGPGLRSEPHGVVDRAMPPGGLGLELGLCVLRVVYQEVDTLYQLECTR